MAATKDRVGARQPKLAASGGTPVATLNLDAGWLAQAIEARELAFRLHRLHLQKDEAAVVCSDACSTELTEDAGKLMADYLAASERLFELTAALAAREHSPQSPSCVDNSERLALSDEASNERVQE